jgi:hypothetical protein
MADPDAPAPNGEPAESASGTPRWVKVFAVVAVVILVVVVVSLLVDGDHGPSRHAGQQPSWSGVRSALV